MGECGLGVACLLGDSGQAHISPGQLGIGRDGPREIVMRAGPVSQMESDVTNPAGRRRRRRVFRQKFKIGFLGFLKPTFTP
jgi:hypothetical protein